MASYDKFKSSTPMGMRSMSLIEDFGPWGLMKGFQEYLGAYQGYIGAILALFWSYCGCARQVGGSQYYIVAIGAIWRLFGGCQCYLEVISAIWV